LGAPSTGACFFSLSKSRITNYSHLPGKFSKFIFCFLHHYLRNFRPFYPLDKIFSESGRSSPAAQHRAESQSHQVQHDRNVGPNRSVGAMPQSGRRLLIVFLQNMSRNDLPREFVQLIQACFHVMHEDDSIFKRHHGVICVLKNSRPNRDGSSPSQSSTAYTAATSSLSASDKSSSPVLPPKTAPESPRPLQHSHSQSSDFGFPP